MTTPKDSPKHDASRRGFLKASLLAGAAGAVGFPTIVPSTVFGASAPSNLIHVAQIGCGRIGRDSEMPGVTKNPDLARYVAVCDLDTVRIGDAKELISAAYAKKKVKAPELKAYGNYKELLADKSIDAVCISTPDHWHAQIAIEAALAGKAIYLQKPASLTIVEGRQMANVVKQTGVVFQQGSQQRSALNFRLASELIRNGVIGKIEKIEIGLPVDPAGGKTDKMPVPQNLNYEMWLGETPDVYYTEERVHPQGKNGKGNYGRPGWLRCEQFGAGMITGWGVHHFDIANWAMGWENTGPVEIEAQAEFPAPGSGLWDVHGTYHVMLKYADGTMVHATDKLPNGLKFYGEKGQWIWVSRGSYVATASDPTAGQPKSKALSASDPKILQYKFKAGDTRLHVSPKDDHHRDWLTAIKTKGATVAPAEAGHRACSVSLVSHTAMKLNKKITWDPAKEVFAEEVANKMPMLSRPQRAPYGTNAVLEKAGIKI